jgi:hypothetical protein
MNKRMRGGGGKGICNSLSRTNGPLAFELLTRSYFCSHPQGHDILIGKIPEVYKVAIWPSFTDNGRLS